MNDAWFYIGAWAVISFSHIVTGAGLFFIFRYFQRWTWFQILSAVFIFHGIFGLATVGIGFANLSYGSNPIFAGAGWLAILRTVVGTSVTALIALMTATFAIGLYTLPAADKPTMLAAHAAFLRLRSAVSKK